MADFARTLLLLRVSPLPPGTSRLMAMLTRVGRRLLVASYERDYRRAAGLDFTLLDRWLFVRAVERFVDAIPGEEPALSRMTGPGSRA